VAAQSELSSALLESENSAAVSAAESRLQVALEQLEVAEREYAEATSECSTIELGDNHSGELENSGNVNIPVESEVATTLPAEIEPAVSTGAAFTAPEFTDSGMAAWACSLCTMLNSIEDDACIMCMSARVQGGGEGSGHTSVPDPSGEVGTTAEGGAGAGVGWWCTVCTFINSLGSTR
jgi:hypothetical protein